jgi:acyl-[acyl-carrier-protein]-phospholipid O-acyltransferase/long-chain-fatty-acid--[acyl-carrier-protein] ligase
MKNIIMQASKFVTDKLYNVNMIGDKSVFEQKRLLIIANHPSFLDGILLGLYLPVKPVFLVHTTVKERPIFRQFAKMVDTFEVDPYSPFAIKSIIRLLESGRPVVIFPEGRLTVTGGLMKVYPGAAFAAAKTNATVVSVTIDGAEFSKVSRLQQVLPTTYFPKITLTINPPFSLKMPEVGSAKEKRAFLGEEMRKHLQFALFNKVKPKSLYNAFIMGMNNYGADTPILVDVKRPNKPYAYGEIFQQIQGLRVLLKDKIKNDKRIGVFLPNVSTAVSTIYALATKNIAL